MKSSPERKMHLIKVARTWLNRAQEFLNEGKPVQATDAIEQAGKTFDMLESITIKELNN